MADDFVSYTYQGKQRKMRYKDFVFLNDLWEKVQKKIIPEHIFDEFVRKIDLTSPRKIAEDGFLEYYSQTKGIEVKPKSNPKQSFDIGYLETKFPSVSVEQEFRLLNNEGKVVRSIKECGNFNEKINSAISKCFDPYYVGEIFENNVLRMSDKISALTGKNFIKSLQKLSDNVSRKRTLIGQRLMKNSLLFIDPELEVVEIRSPPCYNPESLRDFLDLSRQAIDEVKGEYLVTPSCILQNNGWYTANVNIHLGIPNMQTISELGFELDIKKFQQVPLVMANSIRDIYSLISASSRNSFNSELNMLWFDKFMQIKSYYKHTQNKDFMIGNKFSWKNYDRQVSHDFRPNVGIRNYGTVEINIDPQSSVDEIVSDAFSFASVSFNSVIEFLKSGKEITRNFSNDSLELHVLKTEIANAVDEKEISAILPNPELKKLMKDKKTKDYISEIFSYDALVADSFVEALISQNFLKKIPVHEFRKQIIARSLDSELFETRNFKDLMMPEQQECGSNTQSKFNDITEMLHASSENFFVKNKKWRTANA